MDEGEWSSAKEKQATTLPHLVLEELAIRLPGGNVPTCTCAEDSLMRRSRGQHGTGACDLGLQGHESLDRQRWKHPGDSKSPGVETPAEKKVHPRSTRGRLSSAP